MFFKKSPSRTSGLPAANRKRRQPANKARLSLEKLEDRAVPASIVFAESTFRPEIFGANIESLVETNFVGYGYAVTAPNGDIVVQGGGGDARIEVDGQLEFTSTTRTEIASTSKAITAAATVKALNDQGLALSDAIGDYFPASWNVDDTVASLTFEDLLGHTTGFTSRFVKYSDLKDAAEAPPPGPQTNGDYDYDYNTTNYSFLRILLPYVILGDATDLDGWPEPGEGDGPDKEVVLADWYAGYVQNQILAPLGVVGVDTGHTQDPPTLLYWVGEDGPGYETPDQRLHVGGMGWNMSAVDVVTFMAGLGNNPIYADIYQTMKDSLLGLSDTVVDKFGTFYAKGGNNFPANNDDGGPGGSGKPTRANTITVDLPNDYQAALVRNSDGSIAVLRTAYENAWTHMVIQGDGDANVFELRLNPDDNLIDLFVDGGDPFFSFRIDVLTSLELRGLGGADQFIIENLPPTLQLVVNGGSGAVSMNADAGALIITGDNKGNDVMIRLNPADAAWIDVVVDNTLITTPATDAWHTLEIHGGGGNDTFYVEDQPQELDLVLHGGADNDSFEIGNPAGNSVFDYIHGSLSVFGGAGTDYLNVNDANGSSSDYTVEGINHKELEVDGSIDASDYTPEKLFLFGQIENLALFANDDPNHITVKNINAGMNVDIHAGAGADTLSVGGGDLGTMKGTVHLVGGADFDLVILDDATAAAGRLFQFHTGSITASNGFGGVTYDVDVDVIRLQAGGHNDTVNVESLDFRNDLELYGNKGNDIFFIAGIGHDAGAVAGEVAIFGGAGYPRHQEPSLAAAEGDDQVYVYDEQAGVTGDYTLDVDGGVLRGRLNKLHFGQVALNVVYEQIERTYLHADDGGNTITVTAAPRFNQLWVYAGAGDDTIVIESTPADATAMHVHGGAGSDTILVSPALQDLGSLHTHLLVDGGTQAPGGQDILTVHDKDSGNAAPYNLSASMFTRSGSAGVSYAGMEELMVLLSNEDNVIDVTSTAPGTTTVVLGQDGDDTLTAQNLASSLQFLGNAGDDSARLVGAGNAVFTVHAQVISLGNGSLTTSEVEHRTIDGVAGQAPLTKAYPGQLILNGVAGVAEAFHIMPSFTPFAGTVGLAPWTPIQYVGVKEVVVNGNAADNDTLRFDGQTNQFPGGGVFHDRFDINLSARGTSKDPVLVHRNAAGQALLTMTDYRGVSVPSIRGLLGADTFNVNINPTSASKSRHIHIDGGGQPGGDLIDRVFVNYRAKGSTVSSQIGNIDIAYLDLLFAIDHQDVEVQLLPF